MSARSIGVLLVALLAATTPQTPSFRSHVDLVSVTATVTARDGGSVTGLTAADFLITEDGAARPVEEFTSEQVPLSLALALDASESMNQGDQFDSAREAV